MPSCTKHEGLHRITQLFPADLLQVCVFWVTNTDMIYKRFASSTFDIAIPKDQYWVWWIRLTQHSQACKNLY